MSLSCSCGDYGDADWWWDLAGDFSILDTKRSRRCTSCGAKLKPGDEVVTVFRWRGPNNDIEERIHGDEVELANAYLCETCGGLHWAVRDLGMCSSLENDIAAQIREYMRRGR
jgi:predicted RNA-binding Zn-ribbon protein involved in translation (DUF1610 family)